MRRARGDRADVAHRRRKWPRAWGRRDARRYDLSRTRYCGWLNWPRGPVCTAWCAEWSSEAAAVRERFGSATCGARAGTCCGRREARDPGSGASDNAARGGCGRCPVRRRGPNRDGGARSSRRDGRDPRRARMKEGEVGGRGSCSSGANSSPCLQVTVPDYRLVSARDFLVLKQFLSVWSSCESSHKREADL